MWILLPFNAQKMVFISVFHILEIKTPGLSEEGRWVLIKCWEINISFNSPSCAAKLAVSLDRTQR